MTADNTPVPAEIVEQYEYEPVYCTDCELPVTVSLNRDAETMDEITKFECSCSVGSVGAVKPDCWTGGQFL